jgi:TolB protein
MNSHTEERLRAAFEAKADQVTAERLDQLAARRQSLVDDTGWISTGDSATTFRISVETDIEDEVTPLVPDRAPSRHARWFAPVLAAAAVLALAVGVTVISTTRNDGTPRPGNSTGPALLGANQQADRSAIPWSQVDAGWTLALWTAATLTKDQDRVPVRPQSVYLVNPIGGRYLITTLNGNFRLKLADWSTDVRTALLIRQGDKSSEVIRLDLSSGKTQSFTTSGKVRLAKFTKPSGSAILLEREGASFERVSLSGAHQLTYPKSRTTDFFTPNHLLSSPDGRTLVFASDHGLAVRAENGTLRRAIAPAGTSACSPVSWWDATSVLAACEPGEVLRFEDQLLFVVPILTPGSATPLAPPPPFFGHPYTLAWRLDSGVLLLDGGGYCGGGVLGELDDTGHIVVRAIPTGLNGYGMNPVGSTRTTVTFMIQVLCGQSPALVSFNPATNQLTRLLGPELNGGSVLDAFGFGNATDD